MSGNVPAIPEPCARTLACIQADPLALPAEAEAHLRGCAACSEARVAWLAQEDGDAETWCQAPSGYFERLPDRILGKLPPARLQRPPLAAHRGHLALWALAATLLAAVAIGGFWAGRANRAPLVEANVAQPAVDLRETLPDTPFREAEDDYAQISALSPDQARALVEKVSARPQHP